MRNVQGTTERVAGDDIRHHTILFGDAWKQTFRDNIDDGLVMGDPSLPATRPAATDPSLAPPGRDLLYVLAPAPNTEVGTVNWDATSASCVQQMVGSITARLPQLGDDAELRHVVTPADWARQGLAAGTPFALAHTFPAAMMSGRLAADRITGAQTRRPNHEVYQR